jgi:hypothetical protein
VVASRRWVRRFLRASRPAIREQPVAQPFGLPAAGIAGGQGQHLCSHAVSSQASITIATDIWFC